MAHRGEHFAQNPGDPSWFLIDLLFAEPEDLKSPRPELEIATPIVRKA
jgi:hypothetical protein